MNKVARYHSVIRRAPTRVALAVLAASLLFTACPVPKISYDYKTLPDPRFAPYQVRPGDIVFLKVLRNQTTTGRYTVRPDGYISLPLGGEVKAANLTNEGLRKAIVSSLKKYIEDANQMISVSVEQVRGVNYAVIGEVSRAGTFESPRYVTVLEALASAGGLSPYADPHGIYVLRRSGEKQLRIPISYPQTVDDPGSNRNFLLLANDIVVVP